MDICNGVVCAILCLQVEMYLNKFESTANCGQVSIEVPIVFNIIMCLHISHIKLTRIIFIIAAGIQTGDLCNKAT